MSEEIQCPLNALEVFWVCEAFGELLVAAEVQEVNEDVEQGLEMVLERGLLQSCVLERLEQQGQVEQEHDAVEHQNERKNHLPVLPPDPLGQGTLPGRLLVQASLWA